MPFPINPSVGDTYVENDTTYEYLGPVNGWFRKEVGPNNDTTYIGSDGAPGGVSNNTEVIFNDNGSLASDSGLTYNKTTDALSGGAFVPTGSTVPSNGFYLPSANNVAISTNGTGRLFVDSSGRLLVGASSTYSGVNGQLLHTAAAGALQYAGLAITTFSSSTGGSSGCIITLDKSNSDTLGTNTAVTNNDQLGIIAFRGADGGSSFRDAAYIQCFVDGTVSGGGAADMPGRLVFSTTADGASSPTERLRINQAGHFLYNYANIREQSSNYSQFGTGATAYPAIEFYASSSSYTSTLQQNIVNKGANSDYNFFASWSGPGASDIEFKLRGDGEAYADGSWNGGGADYAEYFEWSDNNPDEEDRRGISVVLDGDKIRPAEAGEDPIGVISGNPSVVGDAAWNKWNGKYLRDDYGTYILDENGDRQLNPAYDPDVEYISREQRPEWDCVGLMGKLRIRKGQPTGSRWIKMRNISDSVEEWLVR
jgi:hypothetical protein